MDKTEEAPGDRGAVDSLRGELRFERALAVVNRNVLWSLSLGLIPVPVVDLVSLFGVQIKMLRELSKLYKVKFSERIAKKLVTALLTSAGGVSLGFVAGASLTKRVPFGGVVSVSLASGATTFAVGRVFAMHFESGGTLLDFDPKKMRKHFREEFERGKREAAKLRTESA